MPHMLYLTYVCKSISQGVAFVYNSCNTIGLLNELDWSFQIESFVYSFNNVSSKINTEMSKVGLYKSCYTIQAKS